MRLQLLRPENTTLIDMKKVESKILKLIVDEWAKPIMRPNIKEKQNNTLYPNYFLQPSDVDVEWVVIDSEDDITGVQLQNERKCFDKIKECISAKKYKRAISLCIQVFDNAFISDRVLYLYVIAKALCNEKFLLYYAYNVRPFELEIRGNIGRKSRAFTKAEKNGIDIGLKFIKLIGDIEFCVQMEKLYSFNKYEEAKTLAESYLKINPKSPLAVQYYAEYYRGVDRIKIIDEHIPNVIFPGYLFLLRGLTKYEIGDYDEAFKDINLHLEYDPFNRIGLELQYHIAKIYKLKEISKLASIRLQKIKLYYNENNRNLILNKRWKTYVSELPRDEEIIKEYKLKRKYETSNSGETDGPYRKYPDKVHKEFIKLWDILHNQRNAYDKLREKYPKILIEDRFDSFRNTNLAWRKKHKIVR